MSMLSRIGRPALFSVAILAASHQAAFAQGATAASAGVPMPKLNLPVVAPLELLPPVTDPVAQRVLELLKQARTSTKSERETQWLAQLSEFYQRRGNDMVWLNGGSLSPRTIAVAAEIAKAGDYGLDARQFDLPRLQDVTPEATPEQLARFEQQMTMAVLAYAHHARGGRIDPSELSDWLDQKPRRVDARSVMSAVAEAADAAAVLRRMHPQHPQFELLRQVYLKERDGNRTAEPTVVTMPNGPMLKPGDQHPQIAVLRQRLSVPAADRRMSETYDETLGLAIREFQRNAGLAADGYVGPATRRALNRGQTSAQAARVDMKRLIVNMERWRYLPDDLGQLHVWNNLPEYETRVVKNGSVMHQERIIIGKPDTQTPVFSDTMRFVVFQPDWTLPPSLKVKKLLGPLQDGDDDILERSNMRVVVNGREVQASKIKWDKVDIRNVPIIQAPGPSNPLGQMKFMFPNRHAVYMHDTPDKGYFSSAVRTFSSGCIRVRNPRKLAELVMAEDKGWTASDVGEQISPRSKENNRVDLARAIPVHNVYFTMLAEPDGSLRTLNDVYGHDRRMVQALDGRPIASIKADDPALALKEKIDDLVSGEERLERAQVARSRPTGSVYAQSPFFFPGSQPTVMRLQPSAPAYVPQPTYKPARSRDWANRAYGGSQN